MNDSEARRVHLLNSIRMMNSDKKGTPAVHPRYRAVYSNLYHENGEEELRRGTFGIRLCICVLLFALFVAADYREASLFQVNSKKIVNEIEYQINIKDIWNKL